MSNGDSTNPYVGPVPFSTEQKDFFFGRDEESEKLLSLAISERIVLFYAQSGSGKSSLVNAKLIPSLEKKGYKVLPVARVGGDLPENISIDRLDNVFAFNTLLSLAEGKKSFFGDIKKDAKPLIGKSLSDYVKEQGLLEEGKQHWLIIDQFEEIITTHATQDLAKREDFFRQLKQMLEADELLSLVLVMREDHLAGLDTFAHWLPDRLSKRYRIERLKRKEAKDAVRLPALKGGRTFEAGAVEDLVRDLSQERIADQVDTRMGDYVEPLFLQLVCFSLWKSLDELKSTKTPDADKIITKQDVETYGDIDVALKKFYSDAVKVVAEKTGTDEMAIRRWFGETLITPSGIRAQVDRGLLKSGGLSNKAVDQLNKEHLIRLEEARGGKWYELSHDRFVKPIQDSNEEWMTGGGGDSRLARAARLWNTVGRDESLLYRGRLLQNAIARYEKGKNAASPLEEAFIAASTSAEAKRSRRYGFMVATLVVLLLFALASTGYAFYKKRGADQHWQELDRANKQIEEDRLKQKQLYEWAMRDFTAATRLRQLAEEESKKLSIQEKKLRDALTANEKQRKRAEEQTKLTEQARRVETRLKREYQWLYAEGLQQKKELEEQKMELEAQKEELEDQKELVQEKLFEREKEELLARRGLEFLTKLLSSAQLKEFQQFQQPQQSPQSPRRPGCDDNGICTTKNAVVGEVKWKSNDKVGFEFLGNWANEKQFEKNVDIPQLKGIPSGVKDSVEFYRPAVPQLKAAWAEIEKEKLLSSIKSWDGSTRFFSMARKSEFPESHSLGIAFDINASYYVNREGQAGPPERLPQAVIAIFEKHGFRVSSAGSLAHVELVRLDKAPQ